MRISPAAKKALLKNLSSSVDSINGSCERAISQYKSSKTVEDLLSAKRDFVLDIIKELPHGSLHCYFCTTMSMDCANCGYAKVHEPCGSDKSTYYKISETRNAFIHAMEEFHKDEQKYE